MNELEEQIALILRDTLTVQTGTEDGVTVRSVAGIDEATDYIIGEIAELQKDAERFRALLRCGRIKMQGSSGVDPHTGERNGNNVHFGAEFWPEQLDAKYRAEYPEEAANYDLSTKWGVACLIAMADAVLEEEAKALNGEEHE